MAVDRKNYGIALAAAERIRKFWRSHIHAAKYEPVDVKVTPFSYEIISNLVNGYPPLKEA